MRRHLLLVCVLAICVGTAASAQVTVNYGSYTLSPGFSATHWSDVWDLTRGDLTLSYRIDMSGISQTAPYVTSYTEVGLRQAGAGDFNPGPFNTYQGGAGGWMTSLVGNLAPTPGTLGAQDKHNLSASGGRGEGDYDATAPDTIVSPPLGNFNNYGIWFDRDGVDQWQAGYWGSVDGGTYNTGGIYDIVISYHAIDSGLGTMFATVNGIQTGFYSGAWQNAQPDRYPMGLSFKGDMKNMQFFAGLWAMSGADGNVELSNVSITGETAAVPEPMSVFLGIMGLSSIAGLRKLRRK